MVEENFNLQISHESPCIAHVIDESQGNSCAATVTFRQERKGRKRSCETLKKEFNGSHWLGKTSTISVVDDFMGLTPLSGAADAKIHVYFVHGLGGHAFRTWCSDADDDITKMTAWPRDLLPKGFLRENINARVFTLGYNANSVKRAAPNATIQSTAEDLLAHLIADRSMSSQTRPSEIYFICHSLGGLVVSEALIMALYQDEEYVNKTQYRDLFMNGDECLVKGVCFMGTPFLGSGQANLLAPFVKAVKGLNRLSGTNDNFLRSLRENNQSIEVPTIVQRFKTIAKEKNMRLLIGCEEIPVVGSDLTVTYESAISIFKDIAIPFRIPGNHREMVKFDDSGRGAYKQLEGLIMGMIFNRLTLQTPPARPTEEAQYHAGDSTSSPQAQSPASFHDLNLRETSHKHSAAREASPAIINNITYINGYPQPSLGDEEQTYQGGDRHQNQSHRSFPARNLPSRQQTAPVNGGQPRINRPSQASSSRSDQNVRLVNTDDPPENLGTPRRSKSDFHTKRINTDDDIFNRLKIFDTVFIIDDTGSMGLPVRKDDPDGPNRWEVTKDALEHVADIAASHDEDGIDIRFLKATEFDENKIGSGERVVEILEHIDVADENHGGGTEFKNQLESVIRSYLTDYEDYIDNTAEFKRSKGRAGMGAHPKEPKFLNVIVITDGQADDEEEVEEYIVKVAKKLDGMDAPKNYIGIQFIQIGDDDRATSFLQRLDDELKTQSNPIRDIVDTTPYFHPSSESNVPFSQVVEHKLKLLLGGVTKRYDNMQNNKLGK